MLCSVPTDHMPAERQAGVSLWYIARRAGVATEQSDQWILNYVRCLHANDRFPAPLPWYQLTGKPRPGIHFKSRWSRLAVDTWFDGQIPPDLAAAAQDLQATRDADILDSRALQLVA